MSVSAHMDIVLADQRTLKIRGLRSPRGTKQWPELAQMARLALSGWIKDNQVIAHIATGKPDRWGRHLAALWVIPGKQEQTTPSAKTNHPVGPGLIEAGWAITDPGSIEKACLAQYLALEDSARKAGLGLWSDQFYRPLAALDIEPLKQKAGEIILAIGQVEAVRRWKTLTFINFSKSRGKGLGLMLTRRARKAFQRQKLRPESLKGKRIRVRGLLELSRGRFKTPRISVPGPHMIEILQ